MTHLEKTKQLLADTLAIEEEDITPEKTLVELGADSLDEIEIVMLFEEEYGIDIPDEEMELSKTVAEIVKYLEGRVGVSDIGV